MLLFTRRVGGGNGSTPRSGCGSSLSTLGPGGAPLSSSDDPRYAGDGPNRRGEQCNLDGYPFRVFETKSANNFDRSKDDQCGPDCDTSGSGADIFPYRIDTALQLARVHAAISSQKERQTIALPV